MLIGDIAPASGGIGIQFTSGANTNTTSLTGNIRTTGANTYGLYLENSDSNSINFTGSLSAPGYAYAIVAYSTSDNNTITFNQEWLKNF